MAWVQAVPPQAAQPAPTPHPGEPPQAASSPEELRDLYHLYHLYRLCPLYRCSSLCIKRGAFRGTPLIDEHGLNMLFPPGSATQDC